MIKIVLGSLIAGGAIIAAVFVLVAAMNDKQTGAAPLITFTVDDAGLTPAHLELDEDHLVEIRLVNDATLRRTMSAEGNVEQLPVESRLFEPHQASVPFPFVRIEVSSGGAASALVRFTESGTYELRVETAGRPETLQVVTVVVRS